MRVTLDRQVQQRVGRMQVAHFRRPIRQPFHRHRPEHRLQRADMTRLHTAANDPLIASDLLKTQLAHRA